jgi:hypothetical protein
MVSKKEYTEEQVLIALFLGVVLFFLVKLLKERTMRAKKSLNGIETLNQKIFDVKIKFSMFLFLFSFFVSQLVFISFLVSLNFLFIYWVYKKIKNKKRDSKWKKIEFKKGQFFRKNIIHRSEKYKLSEEYSYYFWSVLVTSCLFIIYSKSADLGLLIISLLIFRRALNTIKKALIKREGGEFE